MASGQAGGFCVPQVARIGWWMSAFGAASAKPQYAYANSPALRKVYQFIPTTTKVKKKEKVETCRKYKNKQGKDCYAGTSALKDTETLECALPNFVSRVHLLGMSWEVTAALPCHPCSSPLRIYPDRFGWTISELIKDLRRSSRGCPKIPDLIPKALDSFRDSTSGKETGLFDHADLESAYKYIRGGHGLTIPKEWESEVPKTI